MVFSLFRRRSEDDSIGRLYGAIVAQSRVPFLYSDLRVPDTAEGRFEALTLHMFLLLRRLSAEPGGESLAQGVFDRFWADMDGNLREMGIGDLSVPKRMHKLAGAYYGRVQAYEAAMAEGEAALAAALARNVYAGAPDDIGAAALASYLIDMAAQLASLDLAALSAGHLPQKRSATASANKEAAAPSS